MTFANRMTSTSTTAHSSENNNPTIIVFVVLTIIFTRLVPLPIILTQSKFLAGSYYYLTMLCPGLAALATYGICHRQYHCPSLGLSRCKPRYLLLGIGIPAIYLIVSYGVYWMLFPGTLALDNTPPKNLLLFGLVGFFCAFGEELGWRGLLAPALTAKYGFMKASLLVGVLWAAWNVLQLIDPFHVENFYYKGATVVFFLTTIALSFIMCYLRIKSNSVWPAVVARTIHSLIYGYGVAWFTNGDKNIHYLVGETGIITLAAIT